METSSFRLPKKTGTYADALEAVGLERLLDLLGAGQARIRDQRGFYELTLRESVVLEDLDYGAVHNDPGYRYVKLKENSPAPPNHLDYPAGRERLRNYRERRKSLGDRPTDEQREQLRQVEPEPRWYLYQNANVLQGLRPYNKLHDEITGSDPEAFATALRGKLVTLTPANGVSETRGGFKPEIPAVQVFTPSVGKGVNVVKTAGVRATGLPDNFVDWFDEYLKYLGLEYAANARAVGDDIKLFVVAPGDIKVATLESISEEFFKLKLPWSSAQIDIQGALGLAQRLIEQLAQEDSDEFGKKPREYISGLQTAYFKSLGNARALANTGFVGLPGWFHVTEQNANEWLEILEEHCKVLILLREERSEQAELLFLYRDFLSATDVGALLKFLSSYAPYVIRSRERKNPVRQFTTKNLRRLLMKLDGGFEEVIEDPGFQAVATAIRWATVIEQSYKARNDQIFEIEYGLFQEFKRKAPFREQFVAALSDFVSRYNAEYARYLERTKGNPRRRRPRITKENLDGVIRLLNNKKRSETVAMLLIAYGSASDFPSNRETKADTEVDVDQEYQAEGESID